MKTDRRPSRNRGTALILIVGLLTILAILGTTMLTMARIDRKANMSSDTTAGAQLVVRGVLRQVLQKMKDDLYIAPITSGSPTYRPYGGLWNQSTTVDKWKKFIDFSSDDIDPWLGDHARYYDHKSLGMNNGGGALQSVPISMSKTPIHPSNLTARTYTANQAAHLDSYNNLMINTDGCGNQGGLEAKALIFDTNVQNDQGDRYFASAMVYDLSACLNINVCSGQETQGPSNLATTGGAANAPPLGPQFTNVCRSQVVNGYFRAIQNSGALSGISSSNDTRINLYRAVSLRYFTPQSSVPAYSPMACDENLRMHYSTLNVGRFRGYISNGVVNSAYLGANDYRLLTAHNVTRSLMRYPTATHLAKMPLYGMTTSTGTATGDVTNIFVPDPTNMGSDVNYGTWGNYLNALYAQMKYFFQELGIQDYQKRAAYFCANYRLYRHRTQPKTSSTVNATWYEDPYIAAGGWHTWTSPDGDTVYVVWEQPYISEAVASSLPQWPAPGNQAGAWFYAIEVYNPYYKVSATDNRFTFNIYKGATDLGSFTIGATPLATASNRKVYYDFGGYIDDAGAGTLAVAADFFPGGVVPANAVQVPGLAFDTNTPIRLVKNFTGGSIQLDSVKISEFSTNTAGLAPGTGGTGYVLEGLRDDTHSSGTKDRRRVCLPVYAWRTNTNADINTMKNLLKQHNLGNQNESTTVGEYGLTTDEYKQIAYGDASKAIHNFQTNTASTPGDKQEYHSALWGMPVIMGMQPWAFDRASPSNNRKNLKYGTLAELNLIWALGPTADQDVPHRVRDEFPDTPGRGMLDPAPYKRMNINYDSGSVNATGDRIYTAQTGVGGWTSSIDATHVYPDVPVGALLAEFFEFVPTDKWRNDGEDYRNYGKININTASMGALFNIPWEMGRYYDSNPEPPYTVNASGVSQYHNRSYLKIGTTKIHMKPTSYLMHLIAYREKYAVKDYLQRLQVGPGNPGLPWYYYPSASHVAHTAWYTYTYWDHWDIPEAYPRNYATSRSNLAAGGSDITGLRDASNFEGFVTPGEIAVPLNDYVIGLFAASYTAPGPGTSYNAVGTRHCEPYTYNDNGWRGYQYPTAMPPLMDATTDVAVDIANAVGGDPNPNFGGPKDHPRAKLTPYYSTFAYAETDVPDNILDGIGYMSNDSNYYDFYSTRNSLYAAAINSITVNSDTFGVTIGIYRGPNQFACATWDELNKVGYYTSGSFAVNPGPNQYVGYWLPFAQAGINAAAVDSAYGAGYVVVMSGSHQGFACRGGDYPSGYDRRRLINAQAWPTSGGSIYPSTGNRDYKYYFSSSLDSQCAGMNGAINLTKDSVYGVSVSLGLTNYDQYYAQITAPGFNTGIKDQLVQQTTDSWIYIGVLDRSYCRSADEMPAVLSFGQVK